MSQTPPDLFDVILEAYREWQKTGTVKGATTSGKPSATPSLDVTGKVTVRGKVHEITLSCAPYVPTGTPAEFVDFCRAYLGVNPLTGHGVNLGNYGVVLSDGRNVVLTRGGTQTLSDQAQGIYHVTGQAPSAGDGLPPANAIAITKGGLG